MSTSDTTHSIIITYQDNAVVFYPGNPYIYWHWLTEDGNIRSDHYHLQHNPLTATQFIEHYAEGTD